MSSNKKYIIGGVLVIFLGILFYNLYMISAGDEISDLSKMNTNDQKNLQVRVYLAKELPIDVNRSSGSSSFSVRDVTGTLYKTEGPADLPEDFHTAKLVIMNGHMHPGYFHAASIVEVIQ
jgi:cytochrome c-type biogenesis protein CcmE